MTEFALAVRNAAAETARALENPREGTLITVLRVWSEEICRLASLADDFRHLLLRGMDSARAALEETRHQLAILAKANVVDAGASGFVSFLEGVARLAETGQVPRVPESGIGAKDDTELYGRETHDSDAPMTYRYCTEALIQHHALDSATGELFRAKIRERIAPLGDSLVVSGGREKTRVHIHTDAPDALYPILAAYGQLIEQKADDMRLQRAAAHAPLSRVAIVTDSIADIPAEIAERLQIHVIPQRILRGPEEFLDRLTITTKTLRQLIESDGDFPGSSAPEPKRVAHTFAWISAHYESLIAIPVARAQSVTWQVMENAARALRQAGFPATAVDSRLNSAALGLVVIAAAEDAANGFSEAEILARLDSAISRTRIFVSVVTFRNMIRGGRIGAIKGWLATLSGLKPVVSLDAEGKGIASGASFSVSGSRKRIFRALRREKGAISRYAVVHAGVPERAAAWAADLTSILGKSPDYVMEIAPSVALHAGHGAVAVAYIREEPV
jgi:DegV family protein with EDD domain